MASSSGSSRVEHEAEKAPHPHGLDAHVIKKLVSRSWEESRLLWRLAFPALLTEVFQFSIGFVTTAFVGHLGEVELAAVSVVENILDSSAYGVLFGMGSALDTLSGQAVGAGQLDRLGVYTQQSWIICFATALALSPAYVFAAPLLHHFLHQPAAVSRAAGPYARWAIPRLLAHALNIPLLMFFQAQSRIWAVAAISGAVLGVHALLTYVAVSRLGYGLPGAAVAGDVSHWLVVAAQFAYMTTGGRFADAWKGFTVRAFDNLGAFVKLSLGSAVMICLEFWYYATLLILVGLLQQAKLQIDIMSVCLNFEFMTVMVALGFSTAIGIRVSNELGANRPKEAKFAVLVAVSTSIVMRESSWASSSFGGGACRSSSATARRRGSRSWVASACGIRKRRLLLPSGHSYGYPVWLQAKTWHNGHMDGHVDSHVSPNVHTSCHYLHNKVG